MGLKEQLKEKMALDKLYASALEKIRRHEGKIMAAKEAVLNFLKKNHYELVETRELKIYTHDEDIVVLDNELPIYRHTTIEDVAMRRNPTIKEMVSFTNIKKILVNSDIAFKKRLEAVDYLYKKALSQLDLKGTPFEIKQIFKETILAYEKNDLEKIEEGLELIFEILNYKEIGPELKHPPELIYGIPENDQYRDLVIISPDYTEIKLIRGSFSTTGKDTLAHLNRIVSGKERADIEGIDVFNYWEEQALKSSLLKE